MATKPAPKKRPLKTSAGARSPRPARRAASTPSSASTPWAKLEASPQFTELKRAKAAFIVPACIVFIAYYFALPLLVGYAPQFMARKVYGALNIAYLFALSQFFMAWTIAALYVRAASQHDLQAEAVIALAPKKGGRA